ncbi:hypothetical protein ACSQ67_018127 [Phaseolus vulgaris]
MKNRVFTCHKRYNDAKKKKGFATVNKSPTKLNQLITRHDCYAPKVHVILTWLHWRQAILDTLSSFRRFDPIVIRSSFLTGEGRGTVRNYARDMFGVVKYCREVLNWNKACSSKGITRCNPVWRPQQTLLEHWSCGLELGTQYKLHEASELYTQTSHFLLIPLLLHAKIYNRFMEE